MTLFLREIFPLPTIYIPPVLSLDVVFDLLVPSPSSRLCSRLYFVVTIM